MGDLVWMPQLNAAQCTGCGDCITNCPTGALGWMDGKAALLYPERCVYCATCETVCPTGAIALPYLVLHVSPTAKGE